MNRPANLEQTLDAKGRCCGRKPRVYKSDLYTGAAPHRYCSRCDRAFAIDTPLQVENWAWKRSDDGKFRNRKGQTIDAVA